MWPTNADIGEARLAAVIRAPRFVECLKTLPRPVAITGGTGFLGSQLVDALVDAGIEPRVLLRSQSKPRWIAGHSLQAVTGSLDDRRALEELVRDAATVFHLAGLVRADRAADFDRANRQGTANLVDAVCAAAPNARLVHVSSLAAVGPSEEPSGVGPEAVAAPVSDYGRSKLAAEEELVRRGRDLAWTILRPPAVYGPRDTDVLEFFKMAVRGLFVLPAGERWISVVHVFDVVRALVAAAQLSTSQQVLHLGEPRPWRLDELLGELAARGGYRARFLRLPATAVRAAGAASTILRRVGWGGAALTRDKVREILARHWTTRCADSLATLGLDDGIAFRDGVAATWQWYRQQGWLPRVGPS